MSSDRLERIEAVLAAAMEAAPADQDRTVRDACGEDSALADEVLGLLRYRAVLDDASHPLSDRQLDELGAELAAMHDAPRTIGAGPSGETADLRGERIGEFLLLRPLGQGGMGVVYEAEQERPSRRVAVKLIDGVRGVAALERRLTLEAEILGRLHHPGIAQIYSAGSVRVGRRPTPYLAMELIEDARSITAFADEASLDARARLDLLATVADAVGYAHTRGVVHRDLKPENVLVGSDGRAKVLDFGIARLTSQASLAATTVTREGQILGTLAYMAPEQLAGGADALGPPADVYALGVIAFELLTGRPPLELSGLGMTAAMRLLDRAEAPRLSSIDRGLRGDVETIVGRCLERDPSRRYADARELAADLRRHLGDYPIAARRPSPAYRASRFVRRNRMLTAGVAATTLTLAAGVVVSMVLAARERAARVIAEADRARAEASELRAARGLLSGAVSLASIGRPWEGVRQLYAVPPAVRGWEWHHAAARMPWVVESAIDRSLIDPRVDDNVWGFLDADELLVVNTDRGSAHAVSIVDGTRRPLSVGPHRVASRVKWDEAPAGTAAVLLEDGRIGALDFEAGVFNHWGLTIPPEERKELGHLHAGFGGRVVVAQRVGTRTHIYADGVHVFELDSGFAPGGMHWAEPVFAEHAGEHGTVVVARWAGNGRPARMFAVDAGSWQLVAERDLPVFGGPALDVSGDRLLARTDGQGVLAYALPELTRIGAVGTLAERTDSPVVSPDGSLLLVPATGRAELWAIGLEPEHIGGEASTGVWAMGAEAFWKPPAFSADGRLAIARMPGENWPWIIDTAVSGDSREDDFLTRLEHGHRSWVYQIAVSPDGSLLASAAPEGDIVLWDLVRGEVVARIERPSTKTATVSANMDMPLLFIDDGSTLIFAELRDEPDPDGHRWFVVAMNLETGLRSTAGVSSREEVLDAIAARLVPHRPRGLYHHAAVLADGRIVQGSASPFYRRSVIIRRPGETAASLVLYEGEAVVDAGVAVGPDPTRVAIGEYLMIRIRDTRTNQVVAEIADARATRNYGMAYSPDGSRLAIGLEDGRVLLFETERYERVGEISVPPTPGRTDRNYIFALAWTPDGRRLVVSGNQGVRVLETQRRFARDRTRRAWEADLDAARAGRECSPAAMLLLQIERWAGMNHPADTP